MAGWPRTGTKVSTSGSTSKCPAKGEPQATKTEVRLRETMLVQAHATFPIAVRAKTPPGHAMRSVCLPLPASKLWDGPARSTLDAVLLIGTIDPFLVRTDAVARKRMS